MTQHVVVTGANRGIGLAFVHQYLQRGWQVTAVCRSSSDELNSTGATVIDGIDVTNPEDIARLQAALGSSKIDVLINNAGILRNEVLGDIDYDSITSQFAVNTLGPLRVSEGLLNNLQAGSKIALITSRMGSVADNTSGGRYGYRISKAALNIAGVSLAHDLKSRNIAVAILHPGYVQTDMVNNSGDISAATAAERLTQRIDELTMENTGTFWHSNGEVLPW